MENEIFSLLSDGERKTKLKNVIKTKTGNRLNDYETESILYGVRLNRQYSVFVYENDKDFSAVLALPSGYRGKTVFGQVLSGTTERPGELYDTHRAAAVIVNNVADLEGVNKIHIYIPHGYAVRGW